MEIPFYHLFPISILCNSVTWKEDKEPVTHSSGMVMSSSQEFCYGSFLNNVSIWHSKLLLYNIHVSCLLFNPRCVTNEKVLYVYATADNQHGDLCLYCLLEFQWENRYVLYIYILYLNFTVMLTMFWYHCTYNYSSSYSGWRMHFRTFMYICLFNRTT